MLVQVCCEHQERLRQPLGHDSCCGQRWTCLQLQLAIWRLQASTKRGSHQRTCPANCAPYLQTCVVDIGDNFRPVLQSAEPRHGFCGRQRSASTSFLPSALRSAPASNPRGDLVGLSLQFKPSLGTAVKKSKAYLPSFLAYPASPKTSGA